jgi:hypothetical protein
MTYFNNKIWEYRVHGTPGDIAIADIDQNGILDVVFATNQGYIYALKGTDGQLIKDYPLHIPKINIQIPLIMTLIRLERMVYDKI